MTTYDDLIIFLFHRNCATKCYCRWAECWNCCVECTETHSLCSLMKQISIKMIEDHLY